jgi:predicted metalloendopeptidase
MFTKSWQCRPNRIGDFLTESRSIDESTLDCFDCRMFTRVLAQAAFPQRISKIALAAIISIGIATSNALAAPLNAGIDLSGMDRQVAPGDAFFEYANGEWLRTVEIPPDKPAYGTFAMIADQTRTNLAALIADLGKSGARESVESQQAQAFYAAFMNESAIEAKGIAPLQKQFDAIKSIHDRRDLARVIGANLRADVDPINNTSFHTENLFGVWISQGLNDPDHNFPYLLQGGLGLPDRDYYISDSPKMADLRIKYRAHIEAMLKFANISDAPARADQIFALETKMARAHATRVESEDVHLVQRWRREEMEKNAPGLDWTALLDAASMNKERAFFAWHPKAITGLSALAASEPLEAWQDWLTFHAIERAASFLPKAFVEEHFNFAGKALTGTPQMRSREQRGVDFTSGVLGDAVGKLYVERYFSEDSRRRIQAMIRDLEKAFSKRIDKLIWMAPETKARAKEKLRTLRVGVGYPKLWQVDPALEIRGDDALGNLQRAELSRYRAQLAKLRKPVNRDEWSISPQIVNALNLPLQNTINFPAAILQPPFFDPAADAAHNYAAIGAVIGHEISHSFDDQGSLFDARGRLDNWWTKDDLAHFEAAGQALAKQYDAYRPFPDLAVNGHQTLSENIADLAGLATAYDAFELSLKRNPLGDIDGFTPQQRFFISFAQAWRSKAREAQLRKQIATDGHAPAQYRAATVRNLDPWYGAFQITASQKMYLAPKDRVRVW